MCQYDSHVGWYGVGLWWCGTRFIKFSDGNDCVSHNDTFSVKIIEMHMNFTGFLSPGGIGCILLILCNLLKYNEIKKCHTPWEKVGTLVAYR